MPDLPEIQAPLALHREAVRPEWIDYNGHMNVAYYVLAFDHATDAFLDLLGLGQDYKQDTNFSTYVAEAHVTYEQELKAGDPMRFTTQLLGYDAKRVHYIHLMYHAEQDFLAASNELMTLHVDMAGPRVAPLPAHALARCDQIWQRHRLLPVPPQAGRRMSLQGKRAGR
jgi:acyl-CoA thioester hydrolase